MAAKSTKKGKLSTKDVKANRRVLLEKANEKSKADGEDIADTVARQNEEVFREIISNPGAQTVDALTAPKPPEPAALTLQLVSDTATMFIQGAQNLTAQLLGQPESAPMLVRVQGWRKEMEKLEKILTGDADGPISGLKKLVIEQGQPWGENGSKQLTLAGAVVKVKAVNHRKEGVALTIDDLDPAKVEAYFRGLVAEPEKTLPMYMKATTSWGLKDLSPQQQKNLTALLADQSEWGQGVRQCVKDAKWVMQAPEMANE